MKLPSLNDFFTKATEAFKRFPLTLLWAVVGSFMVIVLIERDALFDENLNLLLMMMLGVSWLISAQFFIEQFKNPIRLWWVKLVVLALLVGFYFTLPEKSTGYGVDVPYIRYVLYVMAGHVFLFVAPFIMSWHEGAFYNYIKSILIAIGRSVLFSAVLYLGLVLALLAVQFLFDLHVPDERYGQLFVLCLGIVNTWVYLADFPREVQHQLRFTFNKATEVFVKFILIPLAGLYIIILYAYSLKIVVQWELPEGWVGYLVTALAGLIFVIQVIIHPVRRDHESSIIRGFYPLFYWLLLPLLVLLFSAIFVRVDAYGITENRYFLILLALFITCASLYLLFSRKQQLRYLPIALFVLIMLASAGPWSAFSVSKSSQLNEFEKLYTTLTSEEIMGTEIAGEKAERFNSVTRFLYDRGYMDKTETILGYDPLTVFEDVSAWNLGNEILTKKGIDVPRLAKNTNFNSYTKEERAIIISGYDYLFNFRLNGRILGSKETLNGFRFTFDEENTILKINWEEDGLIAVPLQDFISKLAKNQKNHEYNMSSDSLSFMHENDKASAKLYFQNISINRKKEGFAIDHASMQILLKIKENGQ